MVDFSKNEDISQIKTRLLSADALTKRVALLDNLKSLKFSWAELEALITSTTISGKRMYIGEASRPNTIVWLLTINGASLSTDMSQRSVVIKMCRPRHEGTWEEKTLDFIDQNRESIIADLIGHLRAEKHPLASFTRWAAWEDAVLQRLPEPGEAQAVILERQAEVDAEGEESEILEEFFADQLKRLKYDAENDVVHIPSSIAARWFNWSQNDNLRVGSVTRVLKQLHSEKRIKRLAPDKSRTVGRGFLWVGNSADPHANKWVDLEDRIAKRDKN